MSFDHNFIDTHSKIGQINRPKCVCFSLLFSYCCPSKTRRPSHWNNNTTHGNFKVRWNSQFYRSLTIPHQKMGSSLALDKQQQVHLRIEYPPIGVQLKITQLLPISWHKKPHQLGGEPVGSESLQKQTRMKAAQIRRHFQTGNPAKTWHYKPAFEYPTARVEFRGHNISIPKQMHRSCVQLGGESAGLLN